MEEVSQNASELSLQKRWFAIRAFSGQEKKVKEELDKQIEALHLRDKISNVFVPYEKYIEIKGGKKITKIRNSFPGYVLVEMVLDNQTKGLILEVNYVMNFLGGLNPTPLRQSEVDRLLSTDRDEKTVGVTSKFEIGIAVKLIEGPFSSLTGIVQDVLHEKMKLKVLINFFGRSTPVEVDFTHVKLISE